MASSTTTISFTDYHPQLSDLREEALAGLTAKPKTLSPKLFYDKSGSELFDRITALPEYYPTRTEIAILEERADELAELFGDDCLLIEYGSGSSRKIRILLDAMRGHGAYLAIDISKQHLIESAEALAQEYPELDVFAVCADYSQPFELPVEALDHPRHRVVFFPGSTIGNFLPDEAEAFLKLTAEELGPNGSLLIGADLQKDAGILEAAYDDAAGVTAAFNLNVLTRLNRELGADFDLADFRHQAIYDTALGRVEMHLMSLREQAVRLGDAEIRFVKGETIHTENSHKYTADGFQALGERCGFRPERVWTDKDNLFSVHYMTVVG